MAVQTVKNMMDYQKAYTFAMQVFELSKRFPPEGRWTLPGQVRRSSRSICNNLREAWAKRRYEAISFPNLQAAMEKPMKPIPLWILREIQATSLSKSIVN